MRTFFRSLVIAAAIGFASVAAAGAQNAPAADRQLITMDFQDVEITVLAKFISEITGRNFILDEKVRGKVTVISPTKITVDEAYRVFQSILEVKGFTTVGAGPAIKIVPVTDAKESGSPLATPGSRGAEFVTQLVPLAFVDPQSLVPVLQPMVSKNGLISAYESTNTLILIDTAENVDRLMEIVSELDVEVPDRGIEIIRLENAFAEQIAEMLEQALDAENQQASAAPRVRVAQPARGQAAADPANVSAGGEPFRVIPDERTNSIIVLAGPVQMRTIRSLVRELDRPFKGVAKINVYRLRYANAVEMVDVLGQLIGGGSGGGDGGTLGSTTSSRRTTRASMGFGGSRSSTSRGLGSRNSGGLGGGGALGDGGGSGRASQQATSASGSGGGEFVGEVNVTADPYTNSLIVSAGPQDYSVLERVIAELDVPRRQVLVEAIILEVSVDKAKALGLELQGAVALGSSGVGLGRVNLENLNAALTNPGTISGLVAAAASNQTVTLPDGTTVPAQVALLTALQNDSDVNVLSAPTILTSDNQEAEIVVAQNIPFIASRASDISNLQNQFTTVERQDVGITLRITPQISEGDVVRLDIYEEVSAVVPNPPVDPNIAGPTTTVRAASTTVVATNGSTVSIGGLISDQVVNQESKVPYLGDIPVLGNFFKSTNDLSNKVNLLIFLTPRIVRDETELQAASLAERDKLRQSVGPSLAPTSIRALSRRSWDRKPGPIVPQRGPLWAPPATEVPPVRAPEPYAIPPYEPPGPPVAPPPVAALPPAAEPAPPPRAAEPPISPEMVGLPRTGVRYVVLLSYLEQGTPPAGFETQNGFLTVYVPDTSGEFFVKGGAYDYTAPGYEAKFTCLEVFPDASSALAVYPEGQRIDGATVHWRPIGADQMRQILAGTSPWKRTR